jgi:hypothetical protein
VWYWDTTVLTVELEGAVQVLVAELRVKSMGQVEQVLMEVPEQVKQVVSHLAQ